MTLFLVDVVNLMPYITTSAMVAMPPISGFATALLSGFEDVFQGPFLSLEDDLWPGEDDFDDILFVWYLDFFQMISYVYCNMYIYIYAYIYIYIYTYVCVCVFGSFFYLVSTWVCGCLTLEGYCKSLNPCSYTQSFWLWYLCQRLLISFWLWYLCQRFLIVGVPSGNST